jgi:RNA polymerase sigma-70 factor (ECF subfamily)
VNTCLNWRKHEQRREHLQHEWAQQDMQVNAADDISAKVQAALLKLPPKQRAAVILTTYDDMSHAEAGRVLGCSETTVSWRVFMARKQLKKWLEPHIGSQ